MKPLQAGLSGMLTGFLFGCAICLVQNISIPDALLRIFILTSAGAWMGVLLAWLNQILPSKIIRQSAQQSEHTDNGT